VERDLRAHDDDAGVPVLVNPHGLERPRFPGSALAQGEFKVRGAEPLSSDFSDVSKGGSQSVKTADRGHTYI